MFFLRIFLFLFKQMPRGPLKNKINYTVCTSPHQNKVSQRATSVKMHSQLA